MKLFAKPTAAELTAQIASANAAIVALETAYDEQGADDAIWTKLAAAKTLREMLLARLNAARLRENEEARHAAEQDRRAKIEQLTDDAERVRTFYDRVKPQADRLVELERQMYAIREAMQADCSAMIKLEARCREMAAQLGVPVPQIQAPHYPGLRNFVRALIKDAYIAEGRIKHVDDEVFFTPGWTESAAAHN